jgi:peptide/nickel transport system permease protein
LGNYVARRLLLFLPTLIGASVLIFAIMRILPGDVAVRILAGPTGQNQYTHAEVVKLRGKLGLDDPVPLQYVRWLAKASKLDFGESVVRIGPVSSDIVRRFTHVTLELAILTTIISLTLGLASGVTQAVWNNTVVDAALRAVSIGGLAMPAFWVGSLLVIATVRLFNWLPPLGFTPFWIDPWKNLQQVALPALSLGYLLAATISRMTRATTLEVLGADYVRTARAKGLSSTSVILRHALRNALLPVVTIAGLQIGALLGGTVIIERLFNLPGVGSAAVSAISAGDYPTVEFVVVLYAFIFLLINLCIDIAYGVIDPRVRHGSQ